MLEVEVISVFKDKDTKERYTLKKKIVVSKERYEEIKEYVKIIKSTKENNQEAED